MRLGRDLDAPIAARGDEYGDYAKFESTKNQVKEVNDLGEYVDGSDPFLKNYNKMMTEMQSFEGEELRDKEK